MENTFFPKESEKRIPTTAFAAVSAMKLPAAPTDRMVI